MKVGFSLSPGGLLLPFHLGALECLTHQGQLVPGQTPVAGSSAGAIAAMTHGCGISPKCVLEATVDVSEQAARMGGARGRLLPLLQQKLEQLVGDEEFAHLTQESPLHYSQCIEQQQQSQQQQQQETTIGIAYRELFPQPRNVLQTTFESRQDLFQATANSCMFPFFATNGPCLWDRSRNNGSLWHSRLVVDGFFTVPRDRFGCPDLTVNHHPPVDVDMDRDLHVEVDMSPLQEKKDTVVPPPPPQPYSRFQEVDRIIAISVFPAGPIGLTAFDKHNVIAPCSHEDDASLLDLVRIATQATSRDELTHIYQLGYQAAERWCRQELELEPRK